MPTRVLATDEAKQAIAQVQGILHGGLSETITRLETQLGTLADPNVWDGGTALQYRQDTWPTCRTALNGTLQQLKELQQRLQLINANIMAAGGNS